MRTSSARNERIASSDALLSVSAEAETVDTWNEMAAKNAAKKKEEKWFQRQAGHKKNSWMGLMGLGVRG